MTAVLLFGLIALSIGFIVLTNRCRQLLEDRDYWHHRYTVSQQAEEIDWCWPTDDAQDIFDGRATGWGYPPRWTRALIVDDVFVWRTADGTPISEDSVFRSDDATQLECAACGDELRMKELGGSLCSRCATLAERWYTKPLPGAQDNRHYTGRIIEFPEPHSFLLAHTNYGPRDEITGSSREWVPSTDPTLIAVLNDQEGLYSDLWVEYYPPVQGPREGSRAPVFREDFAPAVADDDDLPF